MSAISIVVPVLDDAAPLAEGHARHKAGLAELGRPLEFVYVLDGDLPRARAALKALKASGEPVEILSFSRPFGEAAALTVGLRRAAGEVVLTLPATPEVEPSTLPKLVAALETADLVVGRRVGVVPSPRGPRLDRLLRMVLKSPFKDIRSNVRAMTARVAAELTLYGNQHRFVPLVAQAQGFAVREIDLPVLPDVARGRLGRPDWGLVLDVLTIFFLLRFLTKPFRFFGGIGLVVLALGCLATAWLVFVRLVFGVGLADRPALILSTLMIVLGIQILAVGLIGEIIAFAHSREIRDARVDRIVE